MWFANQTHYNIILSEIHTYKYVKKIGKPNVVLNGAAKRDRIIEEARRVSKKICEHLVALTH
jgi:hypothetical protein